MTRGGDWTLHDAQLYCARVNFDRSSNLILDPILLLIKIRNAYAEQGITVPGFDLALAYVWERVRPEEPPKTLKNAWLSKAHCAFGEGASDSIEIGAAIVGSEIQKIPFMGSFLAQIAKWSIDTTKRAWLVRAKPYVSDFIDRGKARNDAELIDALISVLAKELSVALQDDDRKKLVLLLDEYEWAFPAVGMRGQHPVDRALRRFCESADRLAATFFARSKLPWKSNRFLHIGDEDHFELDGLERRYGEEWLIQAAIDDEAVRRSMLDSSMSEEEDGHRCYPLVLDLCLDLYNAFGEKGITPTPQDFFLAPTGLEGKLDDLVNKISRRFEENLHLRDAVDYLALAGRFDGETLDFISSEFQLQLPGGGLDLITSLSIVKPDDKATGPEKFVLHRKIAEVFRLRMDEVRRNEGGTRLIEHFLARANVDHPEEVDADVISSIAIAAEIRERHGASGYVDWLTNAVQVLQAAAKSSELEGLWRRALEITLAEFGEDHPDTATSYNNIAYNLNAQGRYGEAAPLLRQGLEIFQRVLGEDHPDTASSYNNVAYNLNAQGRYVEAAPLYRQGLEIFQRVLGEDHPDTASSYNNVAYNLNAQGRYVEAAPLFQQGLEIRRRVLGEDHPDTAASYNNVASNLDDQGRYGEAAPLYRQGLEIRRRVLGEDHPSTASSYNNVASNLNAQGRYVEAAPLYRQGLEIRRRVLGEDHPDTASSYNNVAYNLDAQGRYGEAEPLYRQGLEIRRRVLGEDHPDTAASYNNIAANLNAQGRYGEAAPLYRQGLEIRRRVLGEDHPDTATSYNNVAYNLNAQGRYGEAEPLLRRALEIRRRVLGEDHPSTAISYNNVASNLDDQGRYVEAAPLYRQGLEICRRVLGEDHPTTRVVRKNLEILLERRR
ncbi:tetratricopeptide repeat protein [Parvularcula bermudensis]|nr:tetratricopeptide repeat protein [Parvularcula bermudensis]